MEEGKKQTVACNSKKLTNVYKNTCATLSNTLLGGVSDQFQSFANQPVVLLVQLNVRENGRSKIATASATVCALKEVNQCIKNRVLPPGIE
jgi:hypothetical protein